MLLLLVVYLLDATRIATLLLSQNIELDMSYAIHLTSDRHITR